LTAQDSTLATAKARTIAVGDAWRLAPGADLLYHADAPWWDHYQGVPEFRGERWTQDKVWGPESAQRWGLRVARSELLPGVSFDQACIHQGWNSGFQAFNLAVLFGASRIILVGFDMQAKNGKQHFNGNHPAGLNRDSPYRLFVSEFNRAAQQLADAGIEVINASRETALTCFPRQDLGDALQADMQGAQPC
jgi:hypothetical protein